jgi:hypothetical protein
MNAFLAMLLAALFISAFPAQQIHAHSSCIKPNCINLPITANAPLVLLGRYGARLRAPQSGGGTRIWGEILNKSKHAVYNVKLQAVLSPITDGYTETKTLNFAPVSFVTPAQGSSPIDFVYPQSGITYRLDSLKVLTWTEDISATFGMASTQVDVDQAVATIFIKNDLTRTLVLSQTTLWIFSPYSLDNVYQITHDTTVLTSGQVISLSQALCCSSITSDQVKVISFGTIMR